MTTFGKLMLSAAILTGTAGHAQTGDCALIGGLLPEGCTSDAAVEATAQAAPEGFVISIAGEPVVGDRRVVATVRKADIALADADVRVTFDGLGADPRLDVELTNAPAKLRAGDAVQVQSRMNYPAFVTRGEVLVIDQDAIGGPRTVLTVPINANGTASFTMPAGDNLTLVHRVYDANNRYDETAPVGLTQTRDSLGDDIELGSDSTARRRIPVNGGAITVYGTGVASGALVQTLDARVTPDPDGSFVLQRILPAGDTVVDVAITGAGRPVYLERAVTIPNSEWFYVGTVDLTFGRRTGGGAAAAGGDFERDFSYGRISGYAKGKTASGWTITANVDTAEEDLRDIFRNLDQKDPYHALRRLDDDLGYLTYGDDSTVEDGAPSQGRFYLRAEKDNSHVMWGTYNATVKGSYYLRNERSLYGAQGVYASNAQTSHGENRVSLEAYAAQPDQLPGRETFLGTGGSAYFLQRQDIGLGSETVTVEVRDASTGVVVETVTLTPGRDYDINYLQGLVVLAEPLNSTTGGGTVVTDPSGENTVHLIVQYEYTPTVGDVDGLSYGGRAEAWITDSLRVGATGIVEQTDVADQEAYGVDARLRVSENSFVDLEYAKTDGLGFGSSISSDGGLIVTNTAATDGTGSAVRIAGNLDLTDLGLQSAGNLSFYGEQREAGFSTLDYQTQNDEDTYGFILSMQPSEQLSWRVYLDSFQDNAATPRRDVEGGVEVTYAANERVTWDLGVEHIDRENSSGDTGTRTDVALRATVKQSEQFTWSLFGQATADVTGSLSENSRYGAGAVYALSDSTTIAGEVSDGSLGQGARLTLNQTGDAGSTTYFGYELLPGRELNGVTLTGRDAGRFVAGGTRTVSETTDVFGENTYDMFGDHTALTSSYGVNYKPNDALVFATSFEMGRIQDPTSDYDRRALSFGVRYKDEDGLTAKARLELRQDVGTLLGVESDATSILVTGSANYKIDDERRLVFSLDHADTDTSNVSVRSGQYTEVGLGYAYRPIDNEKLNLLFSYQYLRDMYGQTIDGTDTLGPRQESHVLSVDTAYDLNEQWTIGAKLGGRISQSSPNDGVAFAQNDAYLAVLNGRYHLTHKWDALLEARYLVADQAGFNDVSFVGALYRHVGKNFKIGVGHNFGVFSDDLTDLTYDDAGTFINLIAKF